jgi:putative addiction module component (TIGR02574 family)
MSGKVEQLAKQAMDLSAEERADLAEQLWASIAGAEQAEIDKAWAEELERRMDDLEAGRVRVIPVDEALAATQRRLRAIKP